MNSVIQRSPPPMIRWTVGIPAPRPRDRCGVPLQNRWHRRPPNADPVPHVSVDLASYPPPLEERLDSRMCGFKRTRFILGTPPRLPDFELFLCCLGQMLLSF